MVGARVVSVGRDDRRWRHGVESGAGLRVGRVGGCAGSVLWGVGAGRGRAAAHLVHGAAEQIELGLARKGEEGGGETRAKVEAPAPAPVPLGRCLVTEALKGQPAPSHPKYFLGPPPHPNRSLLVLG